MATRRGDTMRQAGGDARGCARLAGLAGAATLLLAACASMPAPPPAPVETRLQSGGGDAPPAARLIARETAVGHAISGPGFVGALVFDVDPAGRPVVSYRHLVQGEAGFDAELAFDEPWLASGERVFVGESEEGLTVEVRLVAGPCRTEAGRGERYAQIVAGRLIYEGCARETGPSPRWTRDLFDLLPAVRACAAAHEAALGPARVLHAEGDARRAVVRLQDAAGERRDCRLVGRRAPVITPTPAEAGLKPGEGDPIFVPGAVPAAGDGCFLYERVVDRDGALIGALGFDACATGTPAAPES